MRHLMKFGSGSTKTSNSARKFRGLGSEVLEDRKLMATFAGELGSMADFPSRNLPAEDYAEFAKPAEFAEADQVMELREIAIALNQFGYPAPDDDGPWGPIGPVVHQVVHQLSELVRNASQATEIVSDGVGGILGQLGYPAPDDDGPWGPIGPVVHDLLNGLAKQLAQDGFANGSSGAGYYPNPEDDGDLGPIGPVARHISEKLTSENLTVGSRIGPSGDVGYPAPDDDGDFGPAGPVVHELVHQFVGMVAQGMASGQGELPSDPWGGFDGEPTPGWDNPIVTFDHDLAGVDSLTTSSRLTMAWGQDGYPADDDNGPWGPIGPVIHEMMSFVANALVRDAAAFDAQEISMMNNAGQDGYPNPEDDGDLGPIGPVARVAQLLNLELLRVVQVATDHTDDFAGYEVETVGGASILGASGMPNPEDVDPPTWPPIGPVIHKVSLAAVDMVHQIGEPSAAGFDGARRR